MAIPNFLSQAQVAESAKPAPWLDAGDVDYVEGYETLAYVLRQAYKQASAGKGKERHAKDTVPFDQQPIALINKQIGSIDGLIYQAHKKSLEALRLPQGRNVAEILGAINYLAAAVVALETWAKKENQNG